VPLWKHLVGCSLYAVILVGLMGIAISFMAVQGMDLPSTWFLGVLFTVLALSPDNPDWELALE